jgi:hypothetical protein
MRRFFFLLATLAALPAAALPAAARSLQFPPDGAHAFRLDLPRGWKSTTDKRGGLLLVPPDDHAMVYLAIVTDGALRGASDSAVAAKVTKIAGVVMNDKQDPESITAADGIRIVRGTAFYGTLPARHGLARRARIVLFKLSPDTWAQVWTVTQPGMNAIETRALGKVLDGITLVSR